MTKNQGLRMTVVTSRLALDDRKLVLHLELVLTGAAGFLNSTEVSPSVGIVTLGCDDDRAADELACVNEELGVGKRMSGTNVANEGFPRATVSA